jgi:NAD(P)-dependent dehydrogenase (short-subunit alcohol dehydrogenase family)
MTFDGRHALVTGAASGIGYAVCQQLAARGVAAITAVDMSEQLEDAVARLNAEAGRPVATAHRGDTSDGAFRRGVFEDAVASHGPVSLCVPAAGITLDGLAVKLNRETGRVDLYPQERFERTVSVNLIAPVYWALESIASVIEDREARGVGRWMPDEGMQGAIVFIGSVSSHGNVGQVSYAACKAGLDGARATLAMEAKKWGIRAAIVHPGFTDTPMVSAVPGDVMEEHILPQVQIRRLLRPEEIAETICFTLANAAISGSVWADGGWHTPA